MSIFKRALPRGVIEIEASLIKAHDTLSSVLPEDIAITPKVADELKAFMEPFFEAVKNEKITLGTQVKKTEEKDKLMKLEVLLIKQFIKRLNTCIRISEITGNGLFKAFDRTYYQLLPNQTTLPKLTSEYDVVLQGDMLIRGETKRIADGGTPIQQPDISQVEKYYNKFKAANNEQILLKDDYFEAQKALRAIKRQARTIIKDIWDDVENFYRHEDKESKRNKCRQWGVVYEERESKAEKQ